MYVPNLMGMWGVLSRKPELIPVGLKNLRNRLAHTLSNTQALDIGNRPEQLTILVTDICNLRCKMCHYAHSDEPAYQLSRIGHMEPSVFYKVMEGVEGRPVISFTGGEPLLHHHIIEFVTHCQDSGYVTTLTTNGWFLAKHAEALCAAGLDLLVVSVDGPEPVHNAIRRGKAFERLALGIEKILMLPRRPVVFLNVTISDLNDDQLPAMFEQALAWGVDGLAFTHLWMQTDGMVEAFNSRFRLYFAVDSVGWAVAPDAVDTACVADSLAAIRQRSQGTRLLVLEIPVLDRDELSIWYREPETPVKWTTTRCAWARMKVWPDGTVKACRTYDVGDATREPLGAIWRGPKMETFRRLLNREGVLPICARCCYMAHR